MKKTAVVLFVLSLGGGGVWAQNSRRASTVRFMSGPSSFLGIGVAEIDEARAKALNLKEEHGVEVKSVDDDSPAAKAGIKTGDVVLEYNGQRVEGTEQFIRFVRETPSGRQVKLAISRNGANQTLTATIGSRESRDFFDGQFRFVMPPMPPAPPAIPDTPRVFTSWRSSSLGIESESLSSQLASFFGVKEGVLVRSVTKDSAADKAGLKAGDVITKINDAHITNPREISSEVRASRSKKSLTMTVVRNQKETVLTVKLDDQSGFQWHDRLVDSVQDLVAAGVADAL